MTNFKQTNIAENGSELTVTPAKLKIITSQGGWATDGGSTTSDGGGSTGSESADISTDGDGDLDLG